MQELLNYILSKIVTDPAAVTITSEEQDNVTTLFITAPQEERGVIIGKGGKNIQAIRDIISIIARREGKMVYIKVLD
jgi:predicted RNA-binding protein YlqC (UPF0109 family)